jgi:hypothetical protein
MKLFKKSKGYIAIYSLSIVAFSSLLLIGLFQDNATEAMVLDSYAYRESIQRENQTVERLVREELLVRLEASVTNAANAGVSRLSQLLQFGKSDSTLGSVSIALSSTDSIPVVPVRFSSGFTFQSTTTWPYSGDALPFLLIGPAVVGGDSTWTVQRKDNDGKTRNIVCVARWWNVPLSNIACVAYSLPERGEVGANNNDSITKVHPDSSEVILPNDLVVGAPGASRHMSLYLPPPPPIAPAAASANNFASYPFHERTKMSFAWKAWTWFWEDGITEYFNRANADGQFVDLSVKQKTADATGDNSLMTNASADKSRKMPVGINYNPATKECTIALNALKTRYVYISDGLGVAKIILQNNTAATPTVVVISGGAIETAASRTKVVLPSGGRDNIIVLKACRLESSANNGKIINGALWVDSDCSSNTVTSLHVCGSYAFQADRPPSGFRVTIDPASDATKNALAPYSPCQSVVGTYINN